MVTWIEWENKVEVKNIDCLRNLMSSFGDLDSPRFVLCFENEPDLERVERFREHFNRFSIKVSDIDFDTKLKEFNTQSLEILYG